MAASVLELARRCAQVQPLWGQLRLPDRARYLRRAGQAVVDEFDGLTRALAEAHDLRPGEVGGLELLPATDALAWLADAGARALRERREGAPRGTFPLTRTRIAWEPLGVVGVLGATGAPFAQPLWQVAAALLAGNGVVLVAPDEPGAVGAGWIARLFARASLPEGLLGVAPAGATIEPAGLAKVFAPGGAEGREVAEACAAAGVPVALDRGGGGAVLVLADAGVARAARGAANAAFTAGGRARGAAKRAWVAREVHEAWLAGVVAAARGARAVAATDAVPTAREAVAQAVAAGAQLACGGPVGGGGFAPAVLTGVTDEMRVARERLAVPLLAVSAVASTDEAIAAANASRLREGASVWTASRYEGARIARELRAGPTWLNDHQLGPAALPAVPWGAGVGGEEGVHAYAQPRAITWDPPSGGALWWGPYDERYARAARAVARLRSVRDRDRERAWREGALPIARVAARAVRGRGGAGG